MSAGGQLQSLTGFRIEDADATLNKQVAFMSTGCACSPQAYSMNHVL